MHIEQREFSESVHRCVHHGRRGQEVLLQDVLQPQPWSESMSANQEFQTGATHHLPQTAPSNWRGFLTGGRPGRYFSEK